MRLFLFFGGGTMRKLKKYSPTKFKAKDSRYNKEAADFAVMFIESLCHTKGTWAGSEILMKLHHNTRQNPSIRRVLARI